VPIYEYVCQDCNERFEKLVRSWGEQPRCPACDSGSVEKQLSTFAFAGGGHAPAAASGSCCGRGSCGCHH
jgi:putative FmdB family regulatory protein